MQTKLMTKCHCNLVTEWLSQVGYSHQHSPSTSCCLVIARRIVINDSACDPLLAAARTDADEFITYLGFIDSVAFGREWDLFASARDIGSRIKHFRVCARKNMRTRDKQTFVSLCVLAFKYMTNRSNPVRCQDIKYGTMMNLVNGSTGI